MNRLADYTVRSDIPHACIPARAAVFVLAGERACMCVQACVRVQMKQVQRDSKYQ